MSVAATWIAMGYLPIARTDRLCCECSKREDSPAGPRCTQGLFYVSRTGGCRSFVPHEGAAASAHNQPLEQAAA